MQAVGVAGLVGIEQRYRDGARVDRSEECDDVLEALRRQNGHSITGLGDLLQASRDSFEASTELGPGQLVSFAVTFPGVVDEPVRERVGILFHVHLDVADERLPFVDGDVAVLIDEIIERVAHYFNLLRHEFAATQPA